MPLPCKINPTGSLLPPGCTPIECVITSPNVVIDTKKLFNTKQYGEEYFSEVTLDWKPRQSGLVECGRGITGAATTGTVSAISNGTYYGLSVNHGQVAILSSVPVTSHAKCTLKCTGVGYISLFVNGQYIDRRSSAKVTANSYSFFLGGWHRTNTASVGYSTEIWSWEHNYLDDAGNPVMQVQKFIPVLDPNGKACMFDIVSRKFFYGCNPANTSVQRDLGYRTLAGVEKAPA